MVCSTRPQAQWLGNWMGAQSGNKALLCSAVKALDGHGQWVCLLLVVRG